METISGHRRCEPEQVVSSASFLQPLNYGNSEHYELKVSMQNEAPLQAAAPRVEWGQARVSMHVQDASEALVF